MTVTFTAEQMAAIEAPPGPQLLVAGAGTGKTTAMAQRILHLVSAEQARPDQILGLTFTNKAAAHLKSKVREALGPDADVTVGTYHSFGASLVTDHALELDLRPATRILNRAQAWQLLYGVFDEFRFTRRRTLYPQILLDDALNLASRCSDHLVPVQAVVDDCHDIMESAAAQRIKEAAAMRLELCQVVAAYGRRKVERDLLDFGDQIALAVRLLTEVPEMGAALRDQHPVVLLDEYQDTNYAQRRLLQLIYGEGAAVTAVGDDMQSIYGFRGAHLANIVDFPKHFRPAVTRELQVTFRFGPALVALANRIQGNVVSSLPKTLECPAGAPATTIESFLAADDAEEAATIADDMAKILADGGTCGGTAVLCRKRRLISPIVDALQERGIAVEVVGASGLLDRPEIVDLVCWLELLADPDGTSIALLRTLIGPPYRIGLRDLAAVARHAQAHDLAFATAVAASEEVADLSAEATWRLGRFRSDRSALEAAGRRLPVLELAEAVIDRTGLWQASGAIGQENLLRFLDLAEGFVPVEGEAGLGAFVEYLQLLDESDDDLAEAHLSDADSMKVMTIHQAKGLEFDTVYVPGLAGRGRSQIFPDGRAGENALSNSSALPWWLREDDGIPSWKTTTQKAIEEVIKARRLDEEWRLLYVACTRAKRRLVCSAAHWYRGPAEPQGPSVFYNFVAAQADIVTERFRHEAAEVDPDVAAKERQRAATRDGGGATPGGPGAVVSGPSQLRLDDMEPASAPSPDRTVPLALSVTGLVTYARCPKQFYWTVVRPLPRRSSAAARLGTEIHRWIEQRAGRQLSLIEPDRDDDRRIPRPGHEPERGDVAARLRASFLDSPWAALDPVRVEAPFVLAVGGHLVRGRIDAVYERDGRLELVDFKTGHTPAEGDLGSGTQLDLYGLAAIETWGTDAERLRTTYCYLRSDEPPLVESTDWDMAMVTAVRGRLAGALDDLAQARFGPTPGAWCQGCDFLTFCPAGQTGLRKDGQG